MLYFGFSGKILKIDLTSQKIEERSIPDSYIPKFLGGYGVNNRLFWDVQEPLVDPFSPKNSIVLGVGPLVGTIMPGATKVIATTKSPIIASPSHLHFIDNAVVGSRKFGMMLKNAGYDHLLITGKAEEPVYLRITDEQVSLEPAYNLWNKMDIYQTTDYFIRENPLNGVIAIGKGGEKLVRYALALVDYSGHLGKFGFGAVMGSKNLKAIVTFGTKGVKVAQPREFLRLARALRQKLVAIPLVQQFHDLGITSGWDLQAPLVYEGNLPYRQWKKKYGQKIWKKHKFKHNLACSGCVISCRTDYYVPEGSYQGLTSFTGHHLLPARVALRLGIEEPGEVIKLLDICNRAGLCFFTVGALLNWITRLDPSSYSRDFNTYLNLVEKIISRSDIGELLAEGWYPAAKELETEADAFPEGTGLFKGADAIQDGRTTTLDPQRFTYITNQRPHHGGTQAIYTLPRMSLQVLKEDASHLGISSEEFERVFTPTPYYGQFNVGRYAKHVEDAMAVHNSLGSCIVYTLFGTDIIHIDKLAQFYTTCTGITISPQELKKAGERVFTLHKLLNLREGFNQRDKISRIWLTPRQTPDGPKPLKDYHQEHNLSESDVDRLLDDYYEERGWNKNGIPSKKKLEELGLLEFL